jgi:hypothetical protein
MQLILWYAGTLFRGLPEVRLQRTVVKALDAWVSHAASGILNVGGGADAWHSALYPANPLAFTFSAGYYPRQATPLANLEPEQLAISFVPGLVAKYLHHTAKSQRPELKAEEATVFDIYYWEFGPH